MATPTLKGHPVKAFAVSAEFVRDSSSEMVNAELRFLNNIYVVGVGTIPHHSTTLSLAEIDPAKVQALMQALISIYEDPNHTVKLKTDG